MTGSRTLDRERLIAGLGEDATPEVRSHPSRRWFGPGSGDLPRALDIQCICGAGQEEKETIETHARRGARGLHLDRCMPNTVPPLDDRRERN